VICDGRNGSGVGFSPSTLILSCQCHTTNGPYSIIHASAMPYYLSN